MIGLPTETDEDVLGIADLAAKVVEAYREVKGRRGAKVTVSVSSFVPKPHTPFQWVEQQSMAELARKQQLLRDRLQRERSITLNWHDAKTSFMEGVFARGDRRLGRVLLTAWKNGGYTLVGLSDLRDGLDLKSLPRHIVEFREIAGRAEPRAHQGDVFLAE